MKTSNNTNGATLNKNERFALTVQHENGERHVYYGDSKKAASRNFNNNYPYYTKNVVRKEWDIEEE